MRALTCRHFDALDRLSVEEWSTPRPGAGELAISVEAAAINYADLLMVQGRYQVRPRLPFIPGTEITGTVTSVGKGVWRHKPGDRVMAWCGQGGLATVCVTSQHRVMPLPPDMDYEQGASLFVCSGTALYGIKTRGRLRGGETLLVLGAAGGVGLAAIQVGKMLGARVIAAASSPSRLALCREAGADETLDYTAQDLRESVAEMTAGWGVDVVLDPLGGPYTESALRVMAAGGRMLIVGFASGSIPSVPLNLALLGNRTILGISWGDFVRSNRRADRANHRLLMRWFSGGGIRAIIGERHTLDGASAAMVRMAARQTMGKIVILPLRSGPCP